MVRNKRMSRWLFGAVVLTLAECAAVVAVNVPLVDSAQAQFFRDDRVRQRPQRSGGGLFDGLFGPSPRRDVFEEPDRPSYQGGGGGGDSSRAPAARRAEKGEAPPTTSIVVLGDGMADWLAYGLEEAFGDAPEIGIIRKNRQRSGLIRYDVKGDLDWWHVARDLLAPEKPNYVIMMIGVGDRDNISARDIARETAKKEAEKKEAEKKEAEKKAAAQTPVAAPAADKPTADKPAEAAKTAQTKDAEADKDPEEADQPAIIAPERGKRVSGTIEFRTEQWAQIYSRRIDDTIAALKTKGVPVFWVGLPSIKGPRSTADAVYLNDLYRSRAEKAGAVYIDVWDGFVDEGGKFTTNGPDYEGQVRRLRSADGVYFTKYGARKLAHYVEREIRRYMSNRSLQVSLPSGPAVGPAPDAKSAVRPLAGPVVPLTVAPGVSEELLGGAGSSSARGDAIATQVLVKGEPVAAPAGRADDFAWRQSKETAPSAPAVSSGAPASAPVASAYTEPAAEPKKPDPKAAAAKAAQAEKTKKQESRPRPAQNNAPRPPQPAPQPQPSGPFGWLR
jgi:hypothetical protein